jgi:hypothetical protein
MITDSRFKFLENSEIEESNNTTDLSYVDFKDGEKVLVVNSEADYNRPLFTFNKGYFNNIDEVYLSNLVFSLTYRDGIVNYYEYAISVNNDLEVIKEDIKLIYNFMVNYLENSENNPFGYVVIKIDDKYRTEFDLDVLSSDCLSGYELVSYSINKLKVVKNS